ncbi:hypothetical protein HY387_00885 [Candidatus Daviesbacteria bacterium]|nr:hypothetical protein [Candidatus Daviesbacteria bacterium]
MPEVLSFKTQLEGFAKNPLEISGPSGVVAVLASMTPDNINPQTLRDLMVSSPVDVPTIVEETLRGLFLIDPDQGTTMRAFTEEATVLVFNNGLPVGYYEMADGEVHRNHGAKEYGYTLLPYAARKGARRWHMELKGPDLGGMMGLFWSTYSIRKNYAYFKELGPENVGVFIGDAAVNLDSHRLVIGVSGAQMTEEFLRFLTGGNVKEHTIELFAGIGDEVLAEGIAQRIKDPRLVVARIHPDIRQISTWH